MAIIKTSPKSFAKTVQGSIKAAMNAPLTAMVFQGKKSAPDQIAKDMTLRSRGFISSSLRYKKASRNSLKASYGMIARQRFTGLAEQEFGHSDKKRAATLKSRGSILKRRVAPRFRLKTGVEIEKEKNSPNKKLLARLRRSKYKGLLHLKKEKNIRQGIYRLRGINGRLELIHAVGDIPSQKKRPWMKHTNEKIVKSNTGRNAWKKTMSRYLSDRIRRYSK